MTLEQIIAAISVAGICICGPLAVREWIAYRRRRQELRQALLSDALHHYRQHRRAGCHEIHCLHRLTAAGYDAETVGQVIETIAKEEAQ